MNVIFLDFDGVLDTFHDYIEESKGNVSYGVQQLEKRIAILADICKEYNCKVVIEASAKGAINEETMEINPNATWVNSIFLLFKKYEIDCMGRTPNVIKRNRHSGYTSMWKEDEIRLYLLRHPEIEHYCILDDNDTVNMLHWKTGDLDKVKDHLVETIYYYKDNPEEEGLLPKHKELVGEVLKKENEVRSYVLRKKERNKK